MKISHKRANLIGLSLLGIFGIVGFINLTKGSSLTQIVPPAVDSGHVVRLHSLFLWDGTAAEEPETVSMGINTDQNSLEFERGLSVGTGHIVGKLVVSAVIGGGLRNKIDNGVNMGILGGVGNRLFGDNSLIGGGSGNEIKGINSMIGGGESNSVSTGNSAIVGGLGNKIIDNGGRSVILGGIGNKVDNGSSLVLGSGAVGHLNSFAWSAESEDNSARIDVENGVLIGTYQPISGVRLVVSGAVSLGRRNNRASWTGGEIIVVNDCIYAHDGKNRQTIGRASEMSCKSYTTGTCDFGEALMYQGDQADAYSNFCSTGCVKLKVTCSGGNLVDEYNQTGTYYPYCYN